MITRKMFATATAVVVNEQQKQTQLLFDAMSEEEKGRVLQAHADRQAEAAAAAERHAAEAALLHQAHQRRAWIVRLIVAGLVLLLAIAALVTSAAAQARDPMTGQRDIASYDRNLSTDDGGDSNGGSGGGSRGGSGGGGGGGSGRGRPEIHILQPPSCLPNCSVQQLSRR